MNTIYFLSSFNSIAAVCRNASPKHLAVSAALSSPLVGLISLAALFLFCFVAVHAIRLAELGGRKNQKQPPMSEMKDKNPSAAKQNASDGQSNTPSAAQNAATTSSEKQPEQIFYIVERKKRKRAAEYYPPHEIKFK